MRIRGIHHVTIAVRDLPAARLTFERLFGVQGGRATDVTAFGVRTVDLPIGDSVLQIAAPATADNPLLRFVERKGEGFYNLALEIDDLDETVQELASHGVRVSEPIEIEPGVRSAFVTMTATHGLSLQLVELAGGTRSDSSAPTAADEGGADDAIVPAPAVQTEEPDAAPALDLTPDEWSDVD